VKVIGLTGGVACGKTAVSDLLAQRGYPVIDTDAIVRDLLSRDPEVLARVQEEFATTNRSRLRELVFGDPERRSRLEAILHPRVRTEVERRLEEIVRRKPRTRAAVVVVPLLFEAGWHRNAHLSVAVLSDERLQIERLMQRDSIDEALARRMIAAQMPNAEKARRADVRIDNNGSLAELRNSVDRAVAEIERRIS
jgi:dephospho-CoA kinase